MASPKTRSHSEHAPAHPPHQDQPHSDHQPHQDHSDHQEESNKPLIISIKDIQFEVPARYRAGHPLTEGEAAQLNQVMAENLRNNFTATVAKAVEWAAQANEPVKIDDLKAAFAERAANYQFSGRRVGRVVGDPVTREATKLARTAIMTKLREKNIDPKSLPAGLLDKRVQELLERNPAFREEAQHRINAAKTIAMDVLGSFDLPGQSESQSESEDEDDLP